MQTKMFCLQIWLILTRFADKINQIIYTYMYINIYMYIYILTSVYICSVNGLQTIKQICRHKKRPTYVEIFGEETCRYRKEAYIYRKEAYIYRKQTCKCFLRSSYHLLLDLKDPYLEKRLTHIEKRYVFTEKRCTYIENGPIHVFCAAAAACCPILRSILRNETCMCEKEVNIQSKHTQ